ncbi:NADPH-dependent FMN reductase [Glutamicibacter sp. 287]|uniref:NADPH-dependent FMN reductase n=1 Tax=Glutamicibacter TaxID=1742989 RepID=UPI000BB71458|nr:NADPH-dependent FMN reductase [Glutamicibacter sp. BW80]PCC28481.1 NADPH-dependent FMN reductase [Glutamicibacter sp. BW80]
MKIGIIVGSTRPGRRSIAVAEWLKAIADQRQEHDFVLLDLLDYDLPHLDETIPAAMGKPYGHEHTRAWSEAVASCDGFIIVTPEYNHSIPGVLKDALDYLFGEWHNKAVGFVGYGLLGGSRAVEHLRTISAELMLADVRAQVALSLFTDFVDMETLVPGEHHAGTANQMLDQLLSWSSALGKLREAPNDSPSFVNA